MRLGLADHTRDLTSQPIENPMASRRAEISFCDPRPLAEAETAARAQAEVETARAQVMAEALARAQAEAE